MVSVDVATEVTEEIARGGVIPHLADASTGWAPTMDALVALDRGEADRALARLATDIEDDDAAAAAGVWVHWQTGLWRPWYAAVWAETAVIAGLPDAAERLQHARTRAVRNPIATALVERAAALLASDTSALAALAARLAGLGVHLPVRPHPASCS